MKSETKQTWLANVLIVLATLGRLLPHPANFTPVGAISLVGGSKLPKFWKWIVPFIALVLSDYLLGVFYGLEPWSRVTPFLYAAFAINILLGTFIRDKNRYLKLGIFCLFGSLQFFIFSNLGVWFEGILYPKTFEGFVQCYTMALPFLDNTLMGDLCWSFGLFAAIECSQQLAARYLSPPPSMGGGWRRVTEASEKR